VYYISSIFIFRSHIHHTHTHMSQPTTFVQRIKDQWSRLPGVPNIHQHPKARKAASIITRIGFISKAALYLAIGGLALNSAVQNNHQAASGPTQINENLRSTYVFLVIFVVGIFCYSAFALMFSIFDFDQMGHRGLMPCLARFGRVFSAGFYGYIGVNGVAILINVKNGTGGTSNEIVATLFKTPAGKGALVFLGITFCVVAIVYITYIIKPAKFRRELASEKMHPKLFYACVYIARVGALGRVFFFAAFGVELINAVVGTHGGSTGDTSVLGLAAVLNHLSAFCEPLMIVTASLIIVYAFWCLILARYRRLPAHFSERSALASVGLEWYLKHPKKQQTDNVVAHKEDGVVEMIHPGSTELKRRYSKFVDVDGPQEQVIDMTKSAEAPIKVLENARTSDVESGVPSS